MAIGEEGPSRSYLNFDLAIDRPGLQYRARVIGSPAGEAEALFSAPFTADEFATLAERLDRARGAMRRMSSPQLALAKELGARLHQAVLTREIRSALTRSLDEAEREGAAGVRIRLHLDDAPDLAVLPWELAFDPDPRVGRFLALAEETPLVRYVRLPERVRPLRVTAPLRALVVVANPPDDRYPELDVEREWQLLEEALADQRAAGLIALTRLPRATLSALQDELQANDYHILHYIGHGAFDRDHQDGLVVLEGERGGAHAVSAERLGALLHNEKTLRLVVLNACEGGRASPTDPYAGMAQTLVRMGIPAVVAMQFEISDRAAITFARQFYRGVALGRPVDSALTDARMAIYQQVSEVEWATPVLYMRAPDGRIFDVAPAPVRKAPVPAAVLRSVAAPAVAVAAPVPRPAAAAAARVERKAAPFVAAAALVAVATVAVGAVVVAGRPGVPPATSASPAPIAKGRLFYQARLDAGGSEFTIRNRSLATTPDASVGEIRPRDGAIDLAITTAGPHGNMAVELARVLPARYAAEIDVALRPQANGFRFVSRVSLGDRAEHILVLDAVTETVQLKYSTETQTVDVSQAMPVTGVSAGRTVRLGFARDGPRYDILVDNVVMARGSDDRLGQQGQTFLFRVFEQGIATIQRVRVYALE